MSYFDHANCFNENELISLEPWGDVVQNKFSKEDLNCSIDYPKYPCDPIILIPKQEQKGKTQVHCYLRESLLNSLTTTDRIYRWKKSLEDQNMFETGMLHRPYYKLAYPSLYIDQAGLEQLKNPNF